MTKGKISLLILVLLTLFFRTYRLDDLYQFDWDQERDADVVTTIINERKPVLIGPRVINDSGFFVGPFHYYYLLPFYALFKGNPLAAAFAAILIETVTTVAIYYVTSKLFSHKIAFVAAFIYSISPSVVSWNVMYTPLLSILIFYLTYLFSNGNYKIFPLLIFLFILSVNNHPAMITLVVPIFIAYLLSPRNLPVKSVIVSIFLVLLIFSPLIIFDLRHNFINIKSIVNFIFTPKNINSNPFLFLRSFWRSLNILIIPGMTYLVIERVIIILLSLISFSQFQNRKMKLLISAWILTPLLVLAFYHGDIPEYYYSAALVLLPVFLAIVISKYLSSKYLFFLLLSVLFFQYLNFPTRISGAPTLKDKLAAVSYIVNQKEDQSFNVSYDLPLGMNSGYPYLFKYLKKEPVNTAIAPLYTIFIITNPPPSGKIVFSNQILGVARR